MSYCRASAAFTYSALSPPVIRAKYRFTKLCKFSVDIEVWCEKTNCRHVHRPCITGNTWEVLRGVCFSCRPINPSDYWLRLAKSVINLSPRLTSRKRSDAYLAIPVKAGLHHVRVFNAMQLNVPDAEVKTRTPRHQRHWDTRRKKTERGCEC